MKIKANKILAVVCVIAMIMTMIVPMTLTASAAEPELVATFDFGANGSATHVDGNDLGASKSYTDGNYTLTLTSMSKVYGPAYDATGNSCIKLGTSKVVGTFSFEVPEEVTSVIIYAAKYKSNTSKITVNGAAHTLSSASNNGAYDAITVDTSNSKSVTFTTVSGGVRCMVNTIEFYAAADDSACTHENETEVVEVPATCTEDGSYTFVCGDCGETVSKVLSATGHNSVDNICTECGEFEFPEPTLAEAVAMADGTKVFLRDVVVVEINTPWNSNFGNITVTVEDANGDTLYCYRLATNVEVGDILNITGSIGSYNNAKQLAAGATAVITGKTEVEEPDPVEVTLADAAELEDGTLVLVQGIVTEINTAWSDSYNNISVTITDANGDSLYLYRVYTKVALGEEIAVTGKMATYNNARQLGEGSTAVITKASPLPQLNAVNAHMSVAYKYVEDGTTLSDSQFVLKCGVDAGLASIEGVTAYGIAVTAGNMTVYYTSDTATSWTVGNDVISVAINLGDIINDQDKLGTEFTVSAFVVADGITWESTSAKTYSVAGMIDEYTTQGIEDVAHLYNILVGYGLV